MVVARARHGCIGHGNKIPWDRPLDRLRFAQITDGHSVIMGRRTYDSIGRPLPGRRMIVISRDPDLRIDGCEVYGSLDRAIEAARDTDDEPCVIGGASVYQQALDLATVIHLTEIDTLIHGDASFVFDEHNWTESERCKQDDMVFRTLVRKGA